MNYIQKKKEEQNNNIAAQILERLYTYKKWERIK